MYINTKGLVLRQTAYRETSKILTVLTPDQGKITVSAKGARRKGSKLASVCQSFAFSDMTLSKNRDRWTLTEGQCIESFPGLSDDVTTAFLAAYFCELMDTLSDEDMPDGGLLSLGLNALYALGEEKRPEKLVKAAFELRLLCHAGFTPMVERCAVCGRPDIVRPRFDALGGTVCCRDCRQESAPVLVLHPGALEAMRHIITTPAKRLYAFSLGEESLRNLGSVCEKYVITQLDRSFHSLQMYYSVS